MGRMLKPRLTLWMAALFALFGAFTTSQGAAQRKPTVYTVPQEVLARPSANLKNPIAAQTAMAALGQVMRIDTLNNIYLIHIKNSLTVNQAIAALAKRSDMQFAEPNYIYQIHATPDNALYGSQWYLPKTKTDLAWPLWVADTVTVVPATGPKSPRIVGMLDTGVAFGHQQLFSRIQTNANGLLTGYDFVGGTNNPWDDNGHGTMTAGIVAARINDGYGVAGHGFGIAGMAAWDGAAGTSEYDAVKIMPLKVMDGGGFGSAANIIAGIDYARTSLTPAHILCLAIGAEADSVALQTSVANALTAGIVIVAAAGNDASSLPTFPASYTGVLSVASTDNTAGDTLSSFSNYGSWVRVAAPGSDILSTTNNGGYAYGSGTSMSAAIVAGEAALLRSASPTLSGTRIYNLITGMVDQYTPYDGNLLAAGAGRVNVRDAMLGAKQVDGAGLVSVAMPPVMVNGATGLTGTVTLANTASSGAVSVILTWAGTDITVNGGASPQTVTVTGAASQTFTVAVANAPGAGSVTVTATQTISANTLVRTASSTLTHLLNTLTVTPAALTSGAQGVATLTTNVPVPAGGVTVTLASSAGAVANPSNAGGTTIPSIVIPAGATSATFYVQAANVGSNGGCNITATYNTDVKTQAMTVTAPVLTAISVSPSTVFVGQTTQLTVTLDGNAPAAGIVVAVTSGSVNIMANPGNVTVPSGQSSVTVASPVTASTAINPVAVDTAITLTGTLGAAVPTAVLTVRPLISSVSVSPSAAKGGTTPSPIGTVTLAQPAVVATTIALTSSNLLAATVPATITIPIGATTGTFTVTGVPVAADTTTVITATNQFASRTTTYTSLAPALTSLALTSSNILVGATTTGTVTLDSPAPTGGATVALASSNVNAATVPATVSVAAGSTSGTFTVTSAAPTAALTSTITATYGNVSRSASIVVTPLLASISATPSKLRGGSAPAPVGTVTLNLPAPAATTVTLASNDPSVTVGANVIVPSGASSATFPITTHPVATLANATLTATLAGVSRTTTMTVTAPAITSFIINPNAIVGGSNVTVTAATITIDSPAPTGGMVIALASNNTAAAQPWSAATAGSAITSVTVAAGTTSVGFFVKGFTVATTANVTLSANAASQTVNAVITVQALLTSLSLAPATVIGGVASTATVTLAGAAPTGGLTVNLSTTNTAVATVPPTLVISAGATSGTFPVTTIPLAANGSVNISASIGTAAGSPLKSATLLITAPVVTTLVIVPSTVVNGSVSPNSVGTVTMNGKAPAAFTVALTSSNVNVATVPATVTIPAGTVTANFTITSQPVTADSNTVITAAAPTGGGKTAALTVKPMLLSVAVLPITTIGGTAVTGTVTLNSAAPVGGTVVTLGSSNAAAAAPPASVTVAAGATTATFTVVTSAVAANATAAITASLNGTTRSATLTNQTATITTLVLNGATINAGENSTATITLTGPAPSGGTSVTITVTNSSGTSASAPQTVLIPAGANSATFTVSTAGFTGANRTATVNVKITSIGGAGTTATLTIHGN